MRILYTISGTRNESYQAFRQRILAFTEVFTKDSAIGSVVTALTEHAPPALSVIPFRRSKMALVSLNKVDDALSWPSPPPGFTGAWNAEVAYPVVHQQYWAQGKRTPGVGLLTFFRRKKRLDDNEFLKRWYEGHTVLTLQVHPNVGYVRNRVLKPLRQSYENQAESFANWDGIVEEQYDPASDLLNPARFFGGSFRKMLPTMLEVYRDVKGFIDYGSIHCWLTAEYRLK